MSSSSDFVGDLIAQMQASEMPAPKPMSREQVLERLSLRARPTPRPGDIVKARDNIDTAYRWPAAGESVIVTQSLAVVSLDQGHPVDITIGMVLPTGELTEFPVSSDFFDVTGTILS